MSTPTRFDARDLAHIAVFAALIIVLGVVGPIPVPGLVPITAQTLGVMLAGAVLGPWRGAAAVIVVEVLALVGMPVLSGGRGGAAVFVGPTAGYLLGWIAGAVAIGLIVRSGTRISWWRIGLATVVGGIAVIYLFGIPVQALVTGMSVPDTALSSLVFLPGDLIKAIAATTITLALARAYPPVFAGRARGAQVTA